MKKGLVLMSLLVVLCLCSCEDKIYAPETVANDIPDVVAEEPLRDSLLRSIESELQAELNKEENMTTVGMKEVTYSFAEKWENVADEYYEKTVELVKEKFPDRKNELSEKLDKLKQSHEEFAESKLDMYREIYNMRHGEGSIAGVLYASDYYEAKKEYALEIVRIYEELM